MGLRQSITNRFLEQPFRSLTAEQMAERLELDGLERWGQSRLRVALGEPLLMDEYDVYRPPRAAGWAELQDAFHSTRQQTVALAGQLDQAVTNGVKVPHNQFGLLTVRSWLRYLDIHANMEAKKLRR